MEKHLDTIIRRKQQFIVVPHEPLKKSKFAFKKLATLSLFIFGISLTINPYTNLDTSAANSIDHNNGTYVDDFADNSGLSNYHGHAGTNPALPTSTYAKADTSVGTIKLTNSSGDFSAPYQSSGYVYTNTIMPQSVSQWGTFSFVGNTPAGTAIKIQVTDDYNGAFTEEQLPGNTVGFVASSINLNNLAVLSTSKGENPYSSNEKVARLKFKIILETTDPNITPSIDAISFNWTPKSAVLPVASTLNDSGWPSSNFNNQYTNHSSYSPLSYPVIRWKSDNFTKNSMFFGENKIYQNYLIGQTWVEDRHTYWINRNTGNTVRELDMNSPIKGYGSIDKNGIMYNTEILSDITTAIDLNTGEIKWTYAYGGGHGNSQMVIGLDGTIYTLYQTNLTCNPVCVSHTSTLYAFNPNGTIKYTKDYTLEDEYQQAGSLSIQEDGTLLFGTTTQDIDGQYTNNGKLYAVSPSDGSILWSYNTGDINQGAPVVDSNGDIYVYQYMYNSPTVQKKMYSISSEGDLNWERSIDSSFRGWTDISLGNNGEIIANKLNSNYQGPHYLEKINIADGSILQEVETNYSSALFTDKDNSSYFLSDKTVDNNSISTINNYSGSLEQNWQISGLPPTASEGFNTSYRFSNLIQDEKSWLYSGFTKSVYNPQAGEHDYDQEYATFFALAPWTISSSVVNSGNLKVGDALTFNATTSMQQSNPLTEGTNQMQVVLENDTKVPMTYQSTNGNGDTMWTASTTVTPDMLSKTNNYTIEANADSVSTGMAVNFDNPKTNTSNTGYKITSTFIVDNQAPTFVNLPNTDTITNITINQTITTNPYILKVKPTDNVGLIK